MVWLWHTGKPNWRLGCAQKNHSAHQTPKWTLEKGSIRQQGRLEWLASALAFFQIRISGFATACVGRMSIAFANKRQHGNMYVHVRHIFINLLLEYMARQKVAFVRSESPDTSVERFADQPPSVWPLPWTVPTGSKNAFVRLCLQGLVTFVFRRWL